MKHLLIDFENVQPKNLEHMRGKNVQIYFFIGKKQTYLTVELIKSILGESFSLITIDETGKNALDFILTYHIGFIVSNDSDAEIEIMSNDTGFDAVVNYLKKENKVKNIKRTIVPSHQATDKKSPPPREVAFKYTTNGATHYPS